MYSYLAIIHVQVVNFIGYMKVIWVAVVLGRQCVSCTKSVHNGSCIAHAHIMYRVAKKQDGKYFSWANQWPVYVPEHTSS